MSISISDFYRIDGCNAASYDNYRKIASIVDGFKPSGRKIMYTVLKKNITSPVKVSILKSDAAAMTQYLHGDQSLEGVVVTLAQEFPGTNNIPLLKRKGTFGNRLKPAAAAGRYIFTCKEDYIDKIFRKEDEAILTEQIFEGDKIEPKWYAPVIPMLLVNGSIGLTTGFTQRILQHNPKDLIKWIEAKIDGKKLPKIVPWFNGFIGDVVENKEKNEKNAQVGQDDRVCWLIKGSYKKISNTEIEIYEIPVGYTLEDYVDTLDKLLDDKVIRDYKDLSDDGKFKFEVKLWRSEDQGLTVNSPDILDKLKLVDSTTEIYTAINEDNKVVEYKSADEILEDFYKVRLNCYKKRREWQMNELSQKIKEAVSRYVFISGVIDETIVVAKKTYEQVEKQLKKIDKIIKVNDSYDYLINMPIRSMTKEKLDQLKDLMKSLKEKLDILKKKTPEEIWKEDLTELKNALK